MHTTFSQLPDLALCREKVTSITALLLYALFLLSLNLCLAEIRKLSPVASSSWQGYVLCRPGRVMPSPHQFLPLNPLGRVETVGVTLVGVDQVTGQSLVLHIIDHAGFKP
jgi:hypothetical protein